jgi:16S rRNA processing protein RimM
VAARGPKRIDIGRVIKAHGLRGQVVVGGVRLAREEFVGLGHVWARGVAGASGEPKATRRLVIEEAKDFQHSLIVRFEGFSDRDEAEAIHGAVLEVDEAQLPETEEGTVYLFQLVGLHVANEAGERLGTVREILQTGATPILVVDAPVEAGGGKPRERMFPMSEEVLVRVDTAGGLVTVRVLPGMDDLP